MKKDKLDLTPEFLHHLWRITRIKLHQTLDVEYYHDDLAKMFDIYDLIHDLLIKASIEAKEKIKEYPESEIDLQYGVECLDKIEDYLVDAYRKSDKLDTLQIIMMSKPKES